MAPSLATNPYREEQYVDERTGLQGYIDSRVERMYQAAIDYAITKGTPEGLTFLALWRRGEWEAIARDYPDFDARKVVTYLDAPDSSKPSNRYDPLAPTNSGDAGGAHSPFSEESIERVAQLALDAIPGGRRP